MNRKEKQRSVEGCTSELTRHSYPTTPVPASSRLTGLVGPLTWPFFKLGGGNCYLSLEPKSANGSDCAQETTCHMTIRNSDRICSVRPLVSSGGFVGGQATGAHSHLASIPMQPAVLTNTHHQEKATSYGPA
jgi:hypothetical protein